MYNKNNIEFGRKIAIMQPYFFPYLGYFALIKHSDQFILFDTPQFIRHGWIERNQILKQDGTPMYIKVPLKKHSRDTIIKDIQINHNENWRSKIIAQLVPYKKRAPYYKEVVELLKNIFELDTDNIVEFNHHSLKEVCSYLNIETPITIWSEMNVEIEEATAPDEWALNICKALNVDEYYNPTGGMSFFDREKYTQAGVELSFLEYLPNEYKQFSDQFVPFLSIVDVMMYNDNEKINKMLNNIILK